MTLEMIGSLSVCVCVCLMDPVLDKGEEVQFVSLPDLSPVKKMSCIQMSSVINVGSFFGR